MDCAGELARHRVAVERADAAVGHLVATLDRGGDQVGEIVGGEILPVAPLGAEYREHRFGRRPAFGVDLEFIEPRLVPQRVREGAADRGEVFAGYRPGGSEASRLEAGRLAPVEADVPLAALEGAMHGDGEIERARFIEAAGGDGVLAKRLQLLQRPQFGAQDRRNGAATRLQLDNIAHDALPR
jgi:hypothetical protein